MSRPKPGLDHRPLHASFVVDEVALEHVVLQVFGYPPSVTFHHCPILVFIVLPKNNQAKSWILQGQYLSDTNTATTKYFFRLLRAKCCK